MSAGSKGEKDLNFYLTKGPVVPPVIPGVTPLVQPTAAPVPQGAMPYNAVPIFNRPRQGAAPPSRSGSRTSQALFDRLRES